jgi:hypothetical protein
MYAVPSTDVPRHVVRYSTRGRDTTPQHSISEMLHVVCRGVDTTIGICTCKHRSIPLVYTIYPYTPCRHRHSAVYRYACMLVLVLMM